jgi:hypothetical protein
MNYAMIYSNVGSTILEHISDHLGLDRSLFVDLTDAVAIRSSSCVDHYDELSTDSDIHSLSSSVLRVCSYPDVREICATTEIEPEVCFGSHTDTSFLTVSCCSSTPGLEVFDIFSQVSSTKKMEYSLILFYSHSIILRLQNITYIFNICRRGYAQSLIVYRGGLLFSRVKCCKY